MYAKPSKLMNGNIKSSLNEINQNAENENQQNEESNSTTMVKKTSSLNSGESANSSLQNISTLDSGISICGSSSTPTRDLRCTNTNKSNELKTDDDCSLSNLDNNQSNENSNKNVKLNNLQLSTDTDKLNVLDDSNDRNDEIKTNQKPYEYYEINADFNSTASKKQRLLGEYRPVFPKLKCYEISTEL